MEGDTQVVVYGPQLSREASEPRALLAFLARLSPGSRRTMRQSLDWIAEEFSRGHYNAEGFPWHQLRYEHTQAIRATLAERYAAATANKMLSALRGVLKECWRLGRLDADALARASDLRPVKGTKEPAGRALSDEECAWLRGCANNLQHQLVIRFMLQTGVRRQECADLCWGNVFEDHVKIHGKGGKLRIIPLTKALQRVLEERRSCTDKLAPFDRVFGISASRVWAIIRQAGFNAKINPVPTPHDLRRTFATKMLNGGVDLPTVQRLMGHSDPKTTAGYDRRGLDEARVAMELVWATK